MRTFLVPAALLLLGACAPTPRTGAEPADVTLTARVDEAGADSVTLALTNVTAQRIGYNLCPTSIERRAGTSWVEVPTGRICTMELRILQPGTAATYRMEMPSPPAAGEYRFTTTVEMLGTNERRTVRSGTVPVG